MNKSSSKNKIKYWWVELQKTHRFVCFGYEEQHGYKFILDKQISTSYETLKQLRRQCYKIGKWRSHFGLTMRRCRRLA